MNELFEIRFYQESDFSFVKNSYMRSFRNSNLTRFIPSEIYNPKQSKLFDNLFAKSKILLAVNPTNENQILGYIVYNPIKNCVHYVYVKNCFRGNGIASALVKKVLNPEADSFITHLTPKLKSILFGSRVAIETDSKLSQILTELKTKYDPYLAFEL